MHQSIEETYLANHSLMSGPNNPKLRGLDGTNRVVFTSSTTW
jgi:hypothetical protein